MFRGIFRILISYLLIIYSLFLFVSLIKFSPNDLSFYTTALNPMYSNVLGFFGVWMTSPIVFFYGHAAWIWSIVPLIFGLRVLLGITPKDLLIQFGIIHYLAFLISILITLSTMNFSFVSGGIFGSLIGSMLTSVLPNYIWMPIVSILILLGLNTISKVPYKYWNQLLSKIHSNNTNPKPVYAESIYEDTTEEESKDIIIGEPQTSTVEVLSEQTIKNTNPYFYDEEELHYGSVLPKIDDIDDLNNIIDNRKYDRNDTIPSFLQEIEEDIERPEVFLSKKAHKVVNQEKDILRDAEIDLLAPYLGKSNTFYDKLDENTSIRSQIRNMETTTLKADLQQATECLDELDQSTQLIAPNSQWVAENGIPVTDFIRKSSKVKRLSFDNGILQSPSKELIEQEQQVENLSQEIVSDLIQEQRLDSPIVEFDNPYIEELEIPQHISNFPPVSTLDNTDPIILEDLNKDLIYDIQKDVEDQMFENVSQTLLGITETEKILIEGVERTTLKQQQTVLSLKEKIYEKQKQLAEQYYARSEDQKENIKAPSSEKLVEEVDLLSFTLQDFEQEILELKKESHSLDTVSQALTDDMFVKNTVDISFEAEPNLINNTIDKSDLSEYPSDKLQQEMMIFEDVILKPSSNNDMNILSENLEKKLSNQDNEWSLDDNDTEYQSITDISPIAEELISQNIQNIENDNVEQGINSIISDINLATDEEVDAKIQKYVGEEYTQPELASLMRLELTENVNPEQPIYSFDQEKNTSNILDVENSKFMDVSDIAVELDLGTELSENSLDDSNNQEVIQELEPPISTNNMEYIDNVADLLQQQIDKIDNLVSPEASTNESFDIEDSNYQDVVSYTETEDPVETDLNKELILDNDKIQHFIQDITEEIALASDHTNPAITTLEQPEALLMPSVATSGHLIQPLQYPVESTPTDTQVANSMSDKSNPIFPRIEDLEPNTEMVSKELEDEEIENTMKMIEDTYESFNINMQVVDYNRGPTITRFELEPPSGLKLRTILNLQDDLALQAGTSNLRIISPVEGRSLIGIEVPNKVRRNFLLREQIESTLFENSQAALPLILGVDVGGKEIVGDLATTPHLLIAGTTGSGKSVYVNALIMGLLFKLSAEDLKFIMIDPKMVELELYNGIPHLLAPIITKPEEAMAALEWAVQEMDRRYKILSELSVRNIKEYQNLIENTPTKEQGYEKLPYIVIIVDEFANLMLRSPKDTERHISRLASMSRAVGIHLVLATQRPSVDVVTGVIKANFPSRIAFRVSSKIDSRTIIDRNGADTLLGRGDMLFMSPNYMEPIRIQSPYASSEDVARAVMTVKKNGPPDYVIDFSEVLAQQDATASDSESSRTDALNDALFEEVLRYAVDNGEISASGIQRRFRVGYNRASRLIESMKDMKIISPPPSAGKGWLINITKDEISKYLDL